MEELQNQGVDYDAIDVTASMKNLKEFLAFRDNRMEYERYKQWGQIGLPVVLLPNNRLIFELIDLNGTSCSLTPRG